MGGGRAAVQDPHLEHAVDDAQLLAVIDVPWGHRELSGQPPRGVAVQGELAHGRLDEVVNTAPSLLLVAQVQEDRIIEHRLKYFLHYRVLNLDWEHHSLVVVQ